MQILYISGKPEYAMELFEVQPLNFLLKPLSPEKIINCLEQAIAATKSEAACFEITAHKVFYRIPFYNIRYFESDNKKIIIHRVSDSPLVFHGKLSEVKETVPDDFILVHQSFLVNSIHIRMQRYDELTLDNGEVIPISQTYRGIVRHFLFYRNCSKKSSNGINSRG